MSKQGAKHGLLYDSSLLAIGKAATEDIHDRGAHCNECRQFDYLPVPCPCDAELCSECAGPHQHQCTIYKAKREQALRLANRAASKCMDCDKLVLPPTNLPHSVTDAAWKLAVETQMVEHLHSGCTTHLCIPIDKKRQPKCGMKGCKTRLIAGKIRCKDCATEYCLRHRFAADHACGHTTKVVKAGAAGAVAAGPSSEAVAPVGDGCEGATPCGKQSVRTTAWGAAAELRRIYRAVV